MGSKKSVTVGYRYYMGLHFGLCQGPVDAVQKVVVGDREAWVGEQTTSGTVMVAKPDLFGGDKREGGVSGQLDILMGEPAQTANDYLVTRIGAAMPAFRGILSAVWRGGQVTANNPYIKPWAFRIKRILQGWSSGAAWYAAKAEIFGQSCASTGGDVLSSVSKDFDANLATFYSDGNVYAPGYGDYGNPADYNMTPNPLIITCAATDTVLVTVRADASYLAWSKWLGYGTGSDYYNDPTETTPLWSCEFSVETAESVETSYMTTAYMTAEAANAAAVAAGPVSLTGSTQYAIFLKDSYLHNRGGLSIWATVIDGGAAAQQVDMNPAHILYQCLTDSAWGMGYPTAAIDDASFTAAADALYAENFGLSMVWNQQETIDRFIQVVLDHIGGILYVSPTSGAFALKLIRADYVRASLPQYGPETLLSASDYQRQAWGETINEISVVYTSPCSGKDASTTVQDLANIQTQGGVVAQTRNYPGIRNAALAQRVALRDLQSVSTPLARIKLVATRAAWQLFPGDVFRLTWPDYGIDDVVYRVLEINRGTLQNGEILIDAVEDIFGLPTNTYLVDESGGWEDPSSAPAPALYRKIMEAPYWDLVRSLSAADMAYVDSLAGYLEALAVRPSGAATNYSIYAKVGAAAYEQGGNGDFCPSATIVSALTKTTTSITLANAVDLDLVEVGTYAVIDDEYVLISDIDALAGTATISRGILDTVPAEHLAGARIWFSDGFSGFSTTEYADAESVDVKLLPISGAGELDISLAPVDILTMDQRQYRPYPPGKVLTNTQSYPEWIGGTDFLSLSWAHRDRLLQTAYIVEQSEASIGPEAGTTYNLRIYDESDDLVHTESGLSTTSYTYSSETGQENTVLLMLFDGADGSTSFIDEMGHSVSVFGNAQIDTAQSKAGGSSGLFDGAGDYATISHASDFNFGSGEFTIELWYRPASKEMYSTILCGDEPDFPLCLSHGEIANGGNPAFAIGPNSSSWFTGASNMTLGAVTNGVWYHLALVRQGDTFRAYKDGVQQSTGTTDSAGQAVGNIGTFTIAKNATFYVGCHVDSLKISKQCDYPNGTTFTPPSSFALSRLNGRLRYELEAVRGGLVSYQKHNHTVLREGYGFNYGYYYGGQ